MNHEYSLLGIISLDAGSWAEWFSGGMSLLAIVTALSAYPLAEWRQRAIDRRTAENIGRSIGWKALKMVNATADIHRHIHESLAQLPERGPATPKFAVVQPLGVPDERLPELNQNEANLLLESGFADLLVEADLCRSRYASILFSLAEYKSRHEALFELLPPPIEMDGARFTHRLTGEEHAKVKPYTLMLEKLLEGIIALVDENMVKATQVITDYETAMTKRFGKALLSFDVSAITPTKGQ